MSKKRSGAGYRRRRSQRQSTNWLPWAIGGAVVLLVVLIAAQNLLSQSPGGRGARELEWLEGVSGVSYDAGETDFEYPNPAGLEPGRKWLPALGEEDAPVVVMEFSDIFCSHCRDFNLDALPVVLEEYVATGKVRYVDHFFGFAATMERGVVQAEMCAAEQGRYFEFKHALFQSIEIGNFDIDRAARIAGIDANAFNTCREEQRYAGAIQEMLFVDNSGVAATPTFFVNGQQIPGNNLPGLRQLIEAELAAE